MGQVAEVLVVVAALDPGAVADAAREGVEGALECP